MFVTETRDGLPIVIPQDCHGQSVFEIASCLPNPGFKRAGLDRRSFLRAARTHDDAFGLYDIHPIKFSDYPFKVKAHQSIPENYRRFLEQRNRLFQTGFYRNIDDPSAQLQIMNHIRRLASLGLENNDFLGDFDEAIQNFATLHKLNAEVFRRLDSHLDLADSAHFDLSNNDPVEDQIGFFPSLTSDKRETITLITTLPTAPHIDRLLYVDGRWPFTEPEITATTWAYQLKAYPQKLIPKPILYQIAPYHKSIY